jgi:hypothetical protein
LDGQVLEPEFPATAAALASFEIDQAHAAVIERVLHSDAARRIPSEQWVGAEAQLAGWARQYRPDELAKLASQLIEALDQDGPAPEDDSPQINELYLAKSRHGSGGRITGRLDAATFEVFVRAIRAHVMRGDGQHLCDAKIVPVVLGGDSQPLDVGREKRTATLAQRKAVAARDGGCAHPGCNRPAHRCQIHHVRSWLDGGGTDIDNLVMLCRGHHVMVHQSGWVIRMNRGHPEFVPPKWLDPSQTPRRQPPHPRAAA